MLLLLATGQRGQAVYLLTLSGLQMNQDAYIFNLEEHTKTSKPNNKSKPIRVTAFTLNKAICPLNALKAYRKRTEPLQNGDKKLF